MTYKSLIDLVPPAAKPETYNEVCAHSTKTFGTIARSIDDAISMVLAGAENSVIRVWHMNLFPASDRIRLIEFTERGKEFWATVFDPPYARFVADQLPQGSEPYQTRPVDDIHTITIHHSVGWSPSSSNLMNARNIASYHVSNHGWPGIGYHFLACPDGELLQVNGLDTKSYHAGSFEAPGDENAWSLGICIGGDFRDGRIPSAPAIWSVRSLVADLRRAMTLHCSVIPHKRMPGANTICPGDFPDPWLKQLNYEKLY